MNLPTLNHPILIAPLNNLLFTEREQTFLPDSTLKIGIYMCAMDLDRGLSYPQDYYIFVNTESYSCQADYIGLN